MMEINRQIASQSPVERNRRKYLPPSYSHWIQNSPFVIDNSLFDFSLLVPPPKTLDSLINYGFKCCFN